MASLREPYSGVAQRFVGKRAVVTGSSGGIGEACARQIAAEGASVVLIDIARKEGEALAVELGKTSAGRIAFVHCDISDEYAVAAAFLTAECELGGVPDVLVCMAANFVYREVHEACGADWDRALGVNVKGTAACVKAVIPGMRARGSGSVVLTTSITGQIPFPGFVPYSAVSSASASSCVCTAE